MRPLEPELFFDLDSFEHRDLFRGCALVWDALKAIPSYLENRLRPNVPPVVRWGRPLPEPVVLWRGRVWREGFEVVGGDVTKGKFRVRIEGEETSDAVLLCAGAVFWDGRIFIGKGSVVEPGALIKGPTIIGEYTEIRQGAYVRGKCIIGNRCVVGHTTEMKASVMLNAAKAGHFAYIGDSILGNESNLGAGTKLANLKIKEGSVRIRVASDWIDTGMRKLGAIIGDRVQIGCNAVTNPGTLLGKDSLVFPAVSVKPGYYEPGSSVSAAS